MMDEIETDYNTFWRGIVETNGKLDPDKVKRELYDYHIVMREVSLVYDRLTGGRISKPNTEAETVIAVVEDRMNEDTDPGAEAELGRELIAHAATEPVIYANEYEYACAFCGRWGYTAWHEEGESYPIDHADDCLHLRARAMRGESE